MDFAKSMMAYLRRRGIPNQFERYYEHRTLYEEMSTEEIVADREIYDIFTMCLGGTWDWWARRAESSADRGTGRISERSRLYWSRDW